MLVEKKLVKGPSPRALWVVNGPSPRALWLMSKEYRDILGRYTAMYLKWEREPRKRSGKRGMALLNIVAFLHRLLAVVRYKRVKFLKKFWISRNKISKLFSNFILLETISTIGKLITLVHLLLVSEFTE